MINMKRVLLVLILAIVLLLMFGCAQNSDNNLTLQTDNPLEQNEITSASSEQKVDPEENPFETPSVGGELTVICEYVKQTGSASNQFAVWVEDIYGNYINTLYVTQWTANGGYINRPDSIALWVDKSSIDSMPDYYIDAISGATPKASGTQSYTWNLRDINGELVPNGEYIVYVIGTLRWKNYVLYSANLTFGEESFTVEAKAEYIYEASDKQQALTDTSPENEMINEVTISYIP